jgi:hypothetical protein
MRDHVLEEGTAQLLVVYLGGALLKQVVGGAQHVTSPDVIAGLKDAVAGEIDAQGFVGAVDVARLQVTQDSLHVRQRSRWVVLFQRDADESSLTCHPTIVQQMGKV